MALPFIAQAALAVGPSLLSGLFANKAAKDQRSQEKVDQENKFVDLRAAAEKGGFNPLTALQATGGAGFGAGSLSAGTPPLASIQAISNGLTEFGNVVTGQAELDRATQEAQIEVLQAQAAGYAAPAAASAAASVGGSAPSLRTPSRRAVPVAPARVSQVLGGSVTPEVVQPVAGGTRLDPVSGREFVRPLTADEAASDDIKPTIGNVREDYVVGDNVVSVPVGPDIDEMLMGVAIETADDVTEMRDNFQRRTGYTPFRNQPWHDRITTGIANSVRIGRFESMRDATLRNPYQSPRRGNTWQ